MLEDGNSLLVLVGHENRNGESKKSWHLSISHGLDSQLMNRRIPGRIPTWDEIKEARYKFIPNDVNMAIMFPPKEHYINVHKTTIHLWEIPLAMAELAAD